MGLPSYGSSPCRHYPGPRRGASAATWQRQVSLGSRHLPSPPHRAFWPSLPCPPAQRPTCASLKESCQTADALDGRRSNASRSPTASATTGSRGSAAATSTRAPCGRCACRSGTRASGPAARVTPDPDAGADSGRLHRTRRERRAAGPAAPPTSARRLPADRPAARLLPGLEERSGAGRSTRSGERWHYNDAWFAARGYVVLAYTSRGFVNAARPRLDRRVAVRPPRVRGERPPVPGGLLAEDPFFGVNPRRVVVSGARTAAALRGSR